jgi:hypothetical protein
MTKTLRSRLLAVALTVLIASMAMFFVAFAGKGKSASAASGLTNEDMANLFTVTKNFETADSDVFEMAGAEARTREGSVTSYTDSGAAYKTSDYLTAQGSEFHYGLRYQGTTNNGVKERTIIEFNNVLDLTDNTNNTQLFRMILPNDNEDVFTYMTDGWYRTPRNFDLFELLIEDVENPDQYIELVGWDDTTRNNTRWRCATNVSAEGAAVNSYTAYDNMGLKNVGGFHFYASEYTRAIGFYYNYGTTAADIEVYSATGNGKWTTSIPQIAKAKITIVLTKNYSVDTQGASTGYIDLKGNRAQLDSFNMIRTADSLEAAGLTASSVNKIEGYNAEDPQANNLGSKNAPEILITHIDGLKLDASSSEGSTYSRIKNNAYIRTKTSAGAAYTNGVNAVNSYVGMGATKSTTVADYVGSDGTYEVYDNVPLLRTYVNPTKEDTSKVWYEVSGAEGNANEAIAVPALISHQVLVVEDVTATATKELWQDGAKVQDVTGDTFTVATSGAYTLKYLVDGTEVAEADVKVNTGSVKFDLNGTQITTNWVVGESKEITLDALEAIINEGNKGIYKQVVAFGIDNGEGSAIYTDTETLVLPEVLSILAIDFETIAGASIRLTGAAGLKFTSQLSDESVALLGQIAQNVTYGTIITNAGNYESYDLLLDPANDEYVEGEDYLNIEAPAFYNGTNAFSGSVIFSDPDTIGDKIDAERFGIGYIKFQLQNGPESFIDIIVYGTTGSDLTANLTTALDVADAYYTAGLETGKLSVEELNTINDWYQLGYKAIEA